MDKEKQGPDEATFKYERSMSSQSRWLLCQEFARALYHSGYTDAELDRWIRAALSEVVKINQARIIGQI